MGSNNQPRSFKFYRENEKEVMESLGLKPTKNSGSGWIEKEDGQNDFVICQLKSTDAQSIKVNQKDLKILEQNAMVSHKYPVFAIQFLNTGEVWLMVKPEDFYEVSNYIEIGKCNKPDFDLLEITEMVEDLQPKEKPKIKSSGNARNMFHKKREAKYKKVKSAR